MEKETHIDLPQTNEHLKEKLLKWLPRPDRISTEIEGLMLSRFNEISSAESCFYQPTIAIVVQGFKRSMVGNEEYNYGEQHCMVVGVDMPGVYHITEASPNEPFLSLSIKLDRYIITQLLAEIPPQPPPTKNAQKGVLVSKVSPKILDAFLRLVTLLDNPSQIPVIAPMIIREIHYYLLTSPQGECLRLVNTLGTQSNQVARAISWLRDHYRKPLQVEELATHVNMAPSTFHRHFRRVTTLSPLQFQKRLRLYEAQRLMLLEGTDATTAALEVGYESVTQFNREYKRLFCEPPLRNVSKMRSTDAAPTGLLN